MSADTPGQGPTDNQQLQQEQDQHVMSAAKTLDDFDEAEAGVARAKQRRSTRARKTRRDETSGRSGGSDSRPGSARRRRGGESRSGNGGRSHVGSRRRNKNDTGKPKSNPPGWPDKSTPADLELRPNRTVMINEEQELWFCSNFVRTSKVCSLSVQGCCVGSCGIP